MRDCVIREDIEKHLKQQKVYDNPIANFVGVVQISSFSVFANHFLTFYPRFSFTHSVPVGMIYFIQSAHGISTLFLNSGSTPLVWKRGK